MDLVDIDKVLDSLEESVCAEDANRAKALQQAALKYAIAINGGTSEQNVDNNTSRTNIASNSVDGMENIAIKMPSATGAHTLYSTCKRKVDNAVGIARNHCVTVDMKNEECKDGECGTSSTEQSTNHGPMLMLNAMVKECNENGLLQNMTEQFSSIAVASGDTFTTTYVKKGDVDEEVVQTPTHLIETHSLTGANVASSSGSNQLDESSLKMLDNDRITENSKSDGFTSELTAVSKEQSCESGNGSIKAPVTFGFEMADISDSELNDMLEEIERSDEFQGLLGMTGPSQNGAITATNSSTAASIAVLEQVAGAASVDNNAVGGVDKQHAISESDLTQLLETAASSSMTLPVADYVPMSSSSSSNISEASLECEPTLSNAGAMAKSTIDRPQRPTTLDLKNVKTQQQEEDSDEHEHEDKTAQDSHIIAAYSNDKVSLSNIGNNCNRNNDDTNDNVNANDMPIIDADAGNNEHPNCPVVAAMGPGSAAAGGAFEPESEIVVEQGNVASGDAGGGSAYVHCKDDIGKVPPVWVPDYMAAACMQCATRFTMIKRRHHCRACGQVLCSACCSQKFKLHFVTINIESRVCVQCYLLLTQNEAKSEAATAAAVAVGSAATGAGPASGAAAAALMAVDAEAAAASSGEVENPTASVPTLRSPNPNNPMEYCSTIPPHKQVNTTPVQPPTVIVPIGVLKKDGSYSSSNSSAQAARKRKSVMFSDGIAPGSELASIEQEWNEPPKEARRGPKARNQQGSGNDSKPATPPPAKELARDLTAMGTMGLVAQLFRSSVAAATTTLTPVPAGAAANSVGNDSRKSANTNDAATKSKESDSTTAVAPITTPSRAKRLPPNGCDEQGCFIPKALENGVNALLPPLVERKEEHNCDFIYKEVTNDSNLIERLQHETLQFAITGNLLVHVKVVHLKCCMNRTVINFTTHGMHHVGNDEIIILLEFKPEADNEPPLPVDIFVHLYEVYREAELGRPITELSYTSPRQSSFLGSRENGGFIYIRNTFQCMQEVIVPENPYLIGILIHRYEVPWAKIFPLRLMLRLGAQYRYYPCPHISVRHRESVYAEIAQTIINFLADFRNYTYTLPFIRGMLIHMEKRQTTVLIPRNRQEEVIKAINNSSDHILAFGGNFSKLADGHLVCIQNVNDDSSELYAYSTQAINLQGHTRKVTGANFLVLNEALKTTSGLSGKCSLVEDGLMVQILPAKMEEVRNALRNQHDIDIVCGPLNADEQQTENVKFKWIANDRDFNTGVKSPIDDQSLEGVYNIRVHASFNYSNANYSIRLTDIYIIKFDEWYNSDAKTYANANTSAVNTTRLAEQLGRSVSMALVPFLDLLIASGNNKLGLRATLQQDNVSYEAGSRGTKLPPLYMNALDNHLIPTLHNESNDIEGEPIVMELIFYILNV